MQQLPFWGSANFKCHLTKFSNHGDIAPGMGAPLINSFIYLWLSAKRQVHRLFHSEFSTECDLVLPPSFSSIFSFPSKPPVLSSSYCHFCPSSYLSFNACFKRQFLCKTWTIQLTFLLVTARGSFLSFLTIYNTSFLTWSFQLILDNNQLNALFFNVFISCLYVLRATSTHHQEDQIVLIHHLV